MQIYGDDTYIVNAFTYARKYAPSGCKLYINDFNEYMDKKTQNILDMAKKLKEKGVIDGINHILEFHFLVLNPMYLH